MANFTIGEMRRIITNAYPGESWKKRVKHMYDGQVVAIFYSFMENGKIDHLGRMVVRKAPEASDDWVQTTGTQLKFW